MMQALAFGALWKRRRALEHLSVHQLIRIPSADSSADSGDELKVFSMKSQNEVMCLALSSGILQHHGATAHMHLRPEWHSQRFSVFSNNWRRPKQPMKGLAQSSSSSRRPSVTYKYIPVLRMESSLASCYMLLLQCASRLTTGAPHVADS